MSLAIYSSEQMQQWDQFTIENEPIASIDLMERAASLATKNILGRNIFKSASIFCGPGNNGGDGLVIARLLADVKKEVTVYLLKFGEPSEDFSSNLKRLPKTVKVIELTEKESSFEADTDIIIDAVFGSGLNRAVSGRIGEVISKMNKVKAIKIAIDMPSGLFAVDNHENESFPAVFEADETLTFMAPKMPFFYPSYAGFVGNFRIIDIGLHPEFKSKSIAKFITSDDIKIQKRKTFAHKGDNGYLSILGGIGVMIGATVICGNAAFKSGVGYVNVACSEDGRFPLNTVVPEVIWQHIKNFELSEKSTSIAIGPGLGKSDLAIVVLKQILNTNLPTVLDADALNLIAEHTNLFEKLSNNCILTPHIGEIKRLVGIHRTDEELLNAQKEFSIKHQVYIIQKGPFSKLTTPEGNIFINSTGNPGMASAGMGDALTGIIGSLLAQGYSHENAAIFGMYLHGYAADLHAKDHGQIGLLASDVVNRLPEAINQFVKNEA